ncbi:hypothetical protein Q4I30_003608, partial [Leishmania utingensis]
HHVGCSGLKRRRAKHAMQAGHRVSEGPGLSLAGLD